MKFSHFPKQRLSFKKKIREEFKWAKDTIDSIEGHNTAFMHSPYNYDTYTNNHNTSNYERKLANYRLFNNILDQNDFQRECNPFGLTVTEFNDAIQPYNKSSNKIHVILSDESKRPFNYKAILINDSGIRTKQFERTELMKNLLESKIQNLIDLIKQRSQANQTPNLDNKINDAVKEVIDPVSMSRYNATNFLSSKEIAANYLINYIVKQQRIRYKMNDAFKHGLISGEEFAWVGLKNNNVYVQPLNSLGVFYYKSPETKYIQDGVYAGYRTMMSTADILDTFDLTPKQIKQVEAKNSPKENDGRYSVYDHRNTTNDYMNNYLSSHDQGSYGISRYQDDWTVTHVEWRSQKKIYFLSQINEFGEEEKTIVNEDFPIPDYAQRVVKKFTFKPSVTTYEFDGITLEEAWVPEIWQGVKIGNDIYTNIGPKPYQFRSVDDPNNVKLGYHGVVYSSMNAAPISLMDRMKPFQYLYLLLVHKLKQLIARDKTPVYHFDITMLPDNMSMEKAIYYLEELGIDFYNPLQNADRPGATNRSKITSATNRSNMQQIAAYVQLMEAIDQQISDIAGIPKAREGQASPTEAVTNVQQNLLQSSLVTEVYFKEHYNLWEEILNSTLQLAQASIKDTVYRKQYVLDDLSVKVLEIDGELLQNEDFGIFVSDAQKDHQVFETLKQLTHSLVQNDKARLTDLVKIMKSNSIEELESYIQHTEQQSERLAQQEFEQQRELQLQQLEIEKQVREDEQAHEIEKLLIERETELLKKSLDSQIKDNDNESKIVIEQLKNENKKEIESLKINSTSATNKD